MAEQDIPEGYPDSAPEDLEPDAPALTLEEAEREVEAEHEVSPDGAPPPDSTEREDRFGDSPDVDQLAAQELGNGGSRPEDAANFADNAAEWSRERS
ncbi:MAG: hypothetical protein M3R48_04575 [Candidatus Dormibacteraeota bacterium]|nr:hypothetical protein [Candidatus Dormibacteraeota bacterium]